MGPIDDNLVSDGFEGLQVSGAGWWVRERLVWTDGSQPNETLHSFVLGTTNPCAGWARDLPDPPEPSGDAVTDCEAHKQWYAEQSELLGVRPDDVVFSFQLWDTVEDEGHIGIPPADGAYTPIDGPDDDVVEYAFSGSRVLYDWYALAAEELDCSAEDPWASVPSDTEASARFAVQAGLLNLSNPVRDHVAFQVDGVVVVWDQGGESPGGRLSGQGVFEGCDVTREIEPESESP